MSEKIVELGRHDPTVESVITRLYQNMSRIKGITAVVEWDDGSSDVCCDTKNITHLCFDKEILAMFIHGLIKAEAMTDSNRLTIECTDNIKEIEFSSTDMLIDDVRPLILLSILSALIEIDGRSE